MHFKITYNEPFHLSHMMDSKKKFLCYYFLIYPPKLTLKIDYLENTDEQTNRHKSDPCTEP